MSRSAAAVALVSLAIPGAALARVPVGERPMVLPGDRAAAASVRHADWLVGARPGRAAAVQARRFGGTRVGPAGAFRVADVRARPFAAALRNAGLLLYAEPNGVMQRTSLLENGADGWARGAVVPLTLAPPNPGLPIGIVDDFIDATHPDVGAQTTYLNAPSVPPPVLGPHGTEVASAAAGAQNGVGVLGILPGAPLLSFGIPAEFTCADVAGGIDAEVAAGAKIINLSLGGGDCFTMFRSVQIAYASGRLIVAAAGNEFQNGNPIVYPGAYPHVLSVAAIRQDGMPAAFSSANLAIDIAAPGQGVPVAIPAAFDTQDGVLDGVTVADGTSFASPIVAGAASWLGAARPGLSNGQVSDILRASAVDLPPAGYDRDTGFGLVNLPNALAAPIPAVDPFEPNDGITFVDGTAFGKPDPPVWRGYGKRTVRATADIAEDPLDVYRIRVPARFAFRVRVRPSFGDPDLTVFSSAAKSISDENRVIAHSSRPGLRTESVGIVNPQRSAHAAYVMVSIPDTSKSLNTGYRLEFERASYPHRAKKK
jgi:hypothetical protein